jgi:CheY-like chemotaxis protein
MRLVMLGTDRALGELRAMVLRNAGHSVIFPASRREAEMVIQAAAFDVLIVSYTVSDDTAHELTELARQRCPKCAIIAINRSGWEDKKLEHDLAIAAEDPQALVDAVNSFAPQESEQQAQQPREPIQLVPKRRRA